MPAGSITTTSSQVGFWLLSPAAIYAKTVPVVRYIVDLHKTQIMSAEQKFNSLGLILPPAPKPKGVYKPCLIDGKYLYVSGHGPVNEDGTMMIGRIGKDIDIEQGKLAARQTGLTILSSIKTHFGDLDKIRRVIKVLGMVNCTSDFERHPYVINGCSELFAAVWGEENGIGVRSAVGFGSLPENIPVEIEALFELYQ
jgi:enamine deaminase RidA (YjgF/YER057c/UK114 family)